MPGPCNTSAWCLKRVRWGEVLRRQSGASVIIFAAAAIAVGVAHFSLSDRPTLRPASLYDATIAYPHAPRQRVPNSYGLIGNWMAMLLAACAIELGRVATRHQSLTLALAGILHQVWSCAVAMMVVCAVSEVGKPLTGRLRPDFLSRCLGGDAAVAAAVSKAATVAAAAAGGSSIVVTECAAGARGVMDGRMSFLSGHASLTMAVAWYASFYVLWSLHLRAGAPLSAATAAPRAAAARARLAAEAAHVGGTALVVIPLCISWFVGVSRIWDNVHHVDDVIAGFAAAIVFATPLALQAVATHAAIAAAIDGDGNGGGSAAAEDGEDAAKCGELKGAAAAAAVGAASGDAEQGGRR